MLFFCIFLLTVYFLVTPKFQILINSEYFFLRFYLRMKFEKILNKQILSML